jgi:DNA (cytosine-5)-methyltransferase 1
VKRIGSLFSGIGLLELGLERAGLGSVAWQCEIDPWCRKILARHWPNAERHDDVKTFKPRAVDVVCGGFPCQPFSVAGKQKEFDDERWLWPEFSRVIDETKPAIVVAENVPGLRARGLRVVLADLARLGFDVEWHHFRASDLGAPHERNRIWIVATHPDRIDVREQQGWLGRSIDRQIKAIDRCADQIAANADSVKRWRAVQQRIGETGSTASNSDSVGRLESARRFAIQRGWTRECGWTLDPIARVDDGRTRIVDAGRRRKALGNAVVMPCARVVGRAIIEATTK